MRERFEIKFDEKAKLVVYKWTNSNVKQIGCVQIAHGLSEHVTRYDEFANFLADHGFTVLAEDHYQHGESAEDLETLGQINDYDFIDAVIKSIKLVREEWNDCFTGIRVLFSHSMGSISTQSYIQQYPDDFDKVILSGTDVGDFRYHMLKLITKKAYQKKDISNSSKFVHQLTFGGFQKKFNEPGEFNWLSKNQKNVVAYQADPLCGAPVADKTYHSIACYLINSYKLNNIKKINQQTKIFIFSGAEDPVSNFGKSVHKLYKRYAKAGLNVKMKLYPTLRHETLNENEKQEIFDEVLKFIR